MRLDHNDSFSNQKFNFKILIVMDFEKKLNYDEQNLSNLRAEVRLVDNVVELKDTKDFASLCSSIIFMSTYDGDLSLDDLEGLDYLKYVVWEYQDYQNEEFRKIGLDMDVLPGVLATMLLDPIKFILSGNGFMLLKMTLVNIIESRNKATESYSPLWVETLVRDNPEINDHFAMFSHIFDNVQDEAGKEVTSKDFDGGAEPEGNFDDIFIKD